MTEMTASGQQNAFGKLGAVRLVMLAGVITVLVGCFYWLVEGFCASTTREDESWIVLGVLMLLIVYAPIGVIALTPTWLLVPRIQQRAQTGRACLVPWFFASLLPLAGTILGSYLFIAHGSANVLALFLVWFAPSAFAPALAFMLGRAKQEVRPRADGCDGRAI